MDELDLSKLGNRGMDMLRVKKEESARTTLALHKETRANLERLTQYYNCTIKDFVKSKLESMCEKERSRDSKWILSSAFSDLFDGWKSSLGEDTAEVNERKTFVLDRDIIERLNDISHAHGVSRENIIRFFAKLDMSLLLAKLRDNEAYLDWYRGELEDLAKQVEALVSDLEDRSEKKKKELKFVGLEDVDLDNFGVEIGRIAVECDMVLASHDEAKNKTENDRSIIMGERDE